MDNTDAIIQYFYHERVCSHLIIDDYFYPSLLCNTEDFQPVATNNVITYTMGVPYGRK